LLADAPETARGDHLVSKVQADRGPNGICGDSHLKKSTAKAVLFQGGMLEMQHFCSHRAAVAAKYFQLPEFN
jgi:hypothetical protein